ncbi:MAG TPA: hypothetical protein VF943_16265 [Burkholderiales bacterium]
MLRTILAVLAFSGFAGAAAAQSNTDGLTDKYVTLAGSKENSESLVTGLRNGTTVKLSGGTTFTPPTGKMGNGNIDIALSLAQEKLRQQGITNPTSEQLKTALIGNAQNPGILKQRADGMGWGQIAQSQGVKLGDVMRSDRAPKPDGMARSDRLDKPAQPERVEKPARPERPEKPERPERPSR